MAKHERNDGLDHFVADFCLSIASVATGTKQEMYNMLNKKDMAWLTDDAKKFLYEIVGETCDIFDRQFGSGFIKKDKRISELAVKIIEEGQEKGFVNVVDTDKYFNKDKEQK